MPLLPYPFHSLYGRGKASPIQAWIGPEGSKRLRLPGFSDNWHMKVAKLSAMQTGHLYQGQGRSRVLISLRGWVESIVWLVGLSKWKISKAPSRIETATFRLVSQYLNHPRYRILVFLMQSRFFFLGARNYPFKYLDGVKGLNGNKPLGKLMWIGLSTEGGIKHISK